MTTTVHALYDGVAFRPDEPPDIPANTRVRLTIESPVRQGEPGSFFRTARALKLSGPSDWSTNLEEYLYGPETHPK
jgi:hypothetical protein